MNIVLLAAGKGTRMKQDQPKVLTQLAGRPLIKWSLDLIEEASPGTVPLVVVGYKADDVQNALRGRRAIFVRQEEQLGTGHALMHCRNALEGKGDVLVLYGDHVLVSAATIRDLVDRFYATQAAIALVTYKIPSFDAADGHFQAFGRILREPDGRISAIREYKDASEEEKRITEVNPAYYLFKGAWLWENIGGIKPHNQQKEYYLTDLIEMAIGQGQKVETVEGNDVNEAIGINTVDQLALAEQIMRQRHPTTSL